MLETGFSVLLSLASVRLAGAVEIDGRNDPTIDGYRVPKTVWQRTGDPFHRAERELGVSAVHTKQQGSVCAQVLEHLTQGVLVIHDGKVVAATVRAAELLGIGQQRLLGSTLASVLPAQCSDLVERVHLGASSCTARDLGWDLHSPGHRITVTGTSGPEEGQVVLSVEGCSDPAGYSESESFRRHLQWLGSLAAGMAHEIRNPLGGIRGAAQLLRRDPEPEEFRELTGLIIDQSDRIDSLVERLMTLTRPRPLRREPVSLNRLVHDEVSLLRARYGRDPVEWNLRLDPSLPAVEGDADRLREAVGNLLRNAQEAATSQVTVRSRVEPGERLSSEGIDRGVTLKVDVLDDGPGIDPGRVAELFDPFATTKPHGSGLGLFVARLAVDEHAGQLSVDPGPGRGAHFTLSVTERLPPAGDTSGSSRPEMNFPLPAAAATSSPAALEPLR